METTWLTNDGRKWFVVRQNFLLTDSKLQGLVYVNIKIRNCHPNCFAPIPGQKRWKAAGYHFKQQKIQGWSQE